MADEHSIFKIASNLALACFVSGLVIGAVYYVTAPVATQKAEEMKQESMRSLVAEADAFKEIPGEEGCFAAEKGGKTVAYIIPSESKGYGGKIKLLVAVDTEGKSWSTTRPRAWVTMPRNPPSAISLQARGRSSWRLPKTRPTRKTFRP